MAIIVTIKKNESVGKNVEKAVHCWWECKVVQPMWKSLVEPPYDPAVPFLGIYPKVLKVKAGT